MKSEEDNSPSNYLLIMASVRSLKWVLNEHKIKEVIK